MKGKGSDIVWGNRLFSTSVESQKESTGSLNRYSWCPCRD